MTELNNKAVRQLDREYVFHSWTMQGNLNPLVIAGAKGCELWDYEGKTYLDFSSQLVNVNLGYQHPKVLAAMKAQLESLVTIAPATANLARGEAAKRIIDLAPEGFSKVFFTNAGADANENAIRMASSPQRLPADRDRLPADVLPLQAGRESNASDHRDQTCHQCRCHPDEYSDR